MKTILTIALISFLSLTSCTEELTDCHQIIGSGEIYNPNKNYWERYLVLDNGTIIYDASGKVGESYCY